MFDNQNLKNQQTTGSSSPVPSQNPFVPPQPQVNYGQPLTPPTSKPQTTIPPVANQSAPRGNVGGVEDMFASTDNPYGAPKYNSQLPMGGNPYAGMPRAIRSQNIYGRGFSLSQLLIPFLVVVVIALLGVAGWLSYNYLYTRGSIGINNTNFNQSSTNSSLDLEADANSDFPTETIQTENTSNSAALIAPPGVPIPVINSPASPTASSGSSVSSSQNQSSSGSLSKDSDSDGLTDEDERSLGTDPSNPDTDSDGLTDYAEVRIYYSNPLVSDTDSDGFKDGQEVINGFDPNKSGGARLPTITPVKN